MKYTETIGVVGGMGSYATMDFFRRILEAFPAEKEWDRPRIVIDNRCTMPSRVRAILYHEEVNTIINELACAVRGLLDCGADHLIFACNTSHAFVHDVVQLVPEAGPKIIHIIDTLAQRFQENKISSAYLIASEGTLESNIYQDFFDQYGITLQIPGPDSWPQLWEFIEIVKQGQVKPEARERFCQYCAEIPHENIILGCTEFPVLLSAGELKCGKKVWDPLDSAIDHIKTIIK